MGNGSASVATQPLVVYLNKSIVARMNNTGLRFYLPEGIGT